MTSRTRTVTCSICHEPGHNCRTCWMRYFTPTTGNSIPVWDETIDDWTQSSLHLNYSDERGKLFNLGFSKIFDYDIKQTDISMVWPVKESMSVFGRWSYDWSGSRTVDSFFGLQYDDCCLEVKLGYRKTLDIPASSYYPLAQAEESVLLQVNFKGFTDFGSRVDSIIRQGIRGYAERK